MINSYEIVYSNLVLTKNLQKCSREVLVLIKQQIEAKLVRKPEVFGKPLRKSFKGYRRLRVKNYRIIYKIEENTVKIVFIGKKPDVYQHFLKKMGVV